MILIAYSAKETKFIIHDGYVEITGMYGETLPIDEIASVGLSDTLPRITMRTNGISFGHINKGYYKSKNQGTVKLFLSSSGTPYLFLIRTSGNYVYINFKDSKAAEEMFSQLNAIIRQR